MSRDLVDPLYLIGLTTLCGMGLKVACACGVIAIPLALLFVWLFCKAAIEVLE